MQFFPVEYSTLSAKSLLQLLINNYSIAAGSSITFLKRGFNDTYLISDKKPERNENGETHNNDRKFILRVYKHDWRNLESIETELKLINYLKENEVSVSFPIADKNAKLIHSIEAPEGLRFAVLFSFAEGLQIKKLSIEQTYLLGVETGRIHALTRNKSFGITAHDYDIKVQFDSTLKILKPILVNYGEQYEYLLQLKEEFVELFDKTDKNELRTGICHGDLQSENFHVTKENQFTFFDFDFFGTAYLIYDVGVFIWYDHKNKSPEIIDSFLKGYQTQVKLSSTELKLLPYFSTLRALFQMTLFCTTNNGQQLPLWPAQQVADFVKKVNKWQEDHTK